jgi:cullin-4
MPVSKLIWQQRLRKLISDPANDSKMIDQTLTLKRFADRSISRLFEREAEDTADGPAPPQDDDEPMQSTPALGLNESQRKLELEDAVRKGFRAGMSSRENAPAEWIGKQSPLRDGGTTS